MVYLTPKTTRGQQYWYLVKSFKFNGRVEKVQHYLGSEEPSERRAHGEGIRRDVSHSLP